MSPQMMLLWQAFGSSSHWQVAELKTWPGPQDALTHIPLQQV
jgi:hypothetical protein